MSCDHGGVCGCAYCFFIIFFTPPCLIPMCIYFSLSLSLSRTRGGAARLGVPPVVIRNGDCRLGAVGDCRAARLLFSSLLLLLPLPFFPPLPLPVFGRFSAANRGERTESGGGGGRVGSGGGRAANQLCGRAAEARSDWQALTSSCSRGRRSCWAGLGELSGVAGAKGENGRHDTSREAAIQVQRRSTAE
ncbi:Hypothetical predicted protein [Podarcis lilfordi]|uniref:Uncharacterized protein n=1 Tax=Podarcis lilfordi TaxID=74358 RepID=A0AA35KWY6_9SAUR|nr:Hypothetical predicted protein [Podarcis lilfordi]